MKSLRRSVPSALARSIFGFALSQSLQNKSPRDGCTAMPLGLVSLKKHFKIHIKSVLYWKRILKMIYFSVK
jgi:hypothetical protein